MSEKNAAVEFHTHTIDKLAFVNGFISGVALYPQLFKALVSEEVSGLSSITFLIIAINSIVWSIYSIHRNLFALLIASLLNTVAGVSLFLLSIFS